MRKHLSVLTTAYNEKSAVGEHKWKSVKSSKNHIKKQKHVRINGELSDVFNCRMGVRQEDTLSPLLFIT